MDAFSKDELNALLTAAKGRSERDWLMILVAYWHGLRATEVISLTTNNFSDGFLTIQRLKGSMKTSQPLVEHPEAILNERQALIDYVLKTPAGARLFPITRQHFWRLFQRYGKDAGVPKHKCHPHLAKHSIAMHSIKLAGIENVRQYLGHKSLSSTGAYLRVNDSAASAAVASALLD